MQIRTLLLGLFLVALAGAVPAPADTKVGDTKDGCDKSNVVKFQTASGQAQVKANSSPAPFDLPGKTREITWYCGGSRERSANDKEFNKVKISRAANGAIQWTFFVASGNTAADSGNPQVQLGKSKDACDASQVVTFKAKSGPVSLKAGQSAFKELPRLTKELAWKCGDSNERVANPNAFDFIQVERAGNGALQWYFSRTMTVKDDSTGDYTDMVPGDIVIQAPVLNKTIPLPGFLKSNLDTFWDGQLSTIQQEILKSLGGDKRFEVTSLTLSPAQQSELRVGENADSVLVKYVVHQNTAMVKTTISGAPTVNFRAVFDIELVIFLPKKGQFPVQASRATAFVHHFELHGASAGDDFLAAFVKSRVHAVETNMNGFTQNVKDKVNAALKTATAGIPAPPGTPLMLDATLGTVQGCVKVQPSDVCKFPRVAVPPVVARKVLDTSHDQCSQDKVWIWDYQKGNFVPVAKGSSALIEVDNQRFEWFCGGSAQPDPQNDEWATGPEGTYFVNVKRSASGSQIDWSFQSWK